MRDIINLTWDYRQGWKFIGIELGIDEGTINAINANNESSENCLFELISAWLRGSEPVPTLDAMKKSSSINTCFR